MLRCASGYVTLASFLMGNIQKREDLIASSVDKAEAIEKRLKEIEEEKQAIINKAHNEADSILLQTRQDSEQLRKKLLRQAEDEAAEFLVQARANAEQQRNTLLLSFQDELAAFVCDASEKIVGQTFISEKERNLSRELVESL
jgi:F-type H+-transporting ATPase subunit b